ncbi:hypothetical protein Pcinc_031739 [Petrolisthes cinctipes]|uniref:Uncharacterized protein n=1 Tax=Petrolisthes cinctipes TaxID=88211 RepID=A0AAE1EW00_PETCI|nr:hypothetical protein Pcinc_031739 [Petrolisthes cinctipes]
MYPRDHLSTEHALLVTRALATLHAHTLIQRATTKTNTNTNHQGQGTDNNDVDNNDLGDQKPNDTIPTPTNDEEGDGEEDNKANSNNHLSSDNKSRLSANTTNNEESINPNPEQHDNNDDDERLRSNDSNSTSSYSGSIQEGSNNNTTGGTNNGQPLIEAGCLKDRWTAQISRLHLVESNLTIMVDALTNTLGREERTVGRLEALNQQEEEDVIAIRLRGGNKLDAPPLRDATWVWLTLLEVETLRERYIELCDDYCNAFNKVLLRREASSIVEELSYFDVMRDLGENFLHAFLTIIHKFVVSGTWFFDRGLHTDEGIQSLVDVISFLVDNGIVGSIFVI